MVTKSFNNFWSTIKSMKGSDKTIASIVDGHSTDGAISDHFRSIYIMYYIIV